MTTEGQDNPPVLTSSWGMVGDKGIKLRDLVALIAMHGMMAGRMGENYATSNAYKCADAMLKARKEGV